MKSEKRFIAFMLLTAVVSFLAYINTISYPFVFNTISLIQENEAIKSLKNIPYFFQKPEPLYSPISTATFAVDYSLYGLNASGFRITNIILHTIATVLVGIFSLAFLDRKGAVFSALIFAVHPIHTEAVAGIAGRGEALATIFAIISFKLFLRSGERLSYIASIFAFLLALASSKTSVILPLLLIIYSLYFTDRKAALRVIPHFIISVFYLMLYFMLNQGSYLKDVSLYTHLLTSIKILGIYFKLIFLPIGLNAWYDFPAPDKLLTFWTVFALQVFAVILILAFFSYRFSPRISFIAIFIFLTLIPSIHILPERVLAKEYYLYLPSISFSLLVGMLFERIGQKSMRMAGSLFMIPLILFSILVFQRNTVWRDNFVLIKDIAAKSPESAVIHYNMGVTYDDKGMFNDAIKEYELSIKLNPQLPDPYYNIACIYSKQTNVEDALKALKWALAHGFNPELLKTDPDLDPIRKEPGFIELVERMKKSGEFYH